ncbi:hypothetical protein E2P81_ATG06774 [Venturia nashicola]|nr:hypothetical protein E2P81_ATG06774 [Venturia nashicola]
MTSMYLTAGNAGLDLDYVKSRETGSKAAYSFMIGSDASQPRHVTWTTTTASLADQRVVIEINNANPNVQKVWLRIPDGNYLGNGYPASNNTSLRKLYNGEIEDIRTLPIVDAPVALRRQEPMDTLFSTYILDGLKQAISELVVLTKPVVVRTQDWRGEGRSDHSDHYTTAKLVQDVVGSKGIDIVGYVQYTIATWPVNLDLTSENYTQKSNAFFAYAKYDNQEVEIRDHDVVPTLS